MGRSAWVTLLALVLLLGSSERAAAIPFSEDRSTRFAPNVPNVIELYLPVGGVTTFSATTPSFTWDYGAPWTYSTFAGGYRATLSTTADYVSFSPLPVLWTQGFEQSTATQQTFTLTWNEIQYNWATKTTVQSSWHSAQVTAPGGGGPPGVVPEPSTLLILGLGALGVAARSRRRRRGVVTQAEPPAPGRQV